MCLPMKKEKTERKNVLLEIRGKSVLLWCLCCFCWPGLNASSPPHSLENKLDVSAYRQDLPLKDWRFIRSDVSGAEQLDFDDSQWENVRIPHDWAIYGPFDKQIDIQTVAISQNQEIKATEKTGRTGALPYIGVGWYRCVFSLPSEMADKRCVLMFDGAMSDARVFVNAKEVGRWPYGYNSFYFDITDVLRPNAENCIAVRLENVGKSSRWYPGAGLYRNVYMRVTNPLSVDVWGTYLTSPFVTAEKAEIRLEVQLHIPDGIDESTLRIHTEIVDAEQEKIAESQTFKRMGKQFEQHIQVQKPQLWSPESPYLYYAVTTLYQGDKPVDSYLTRFGIRSISIDSEKGFCLNGQSRKIKGVCLHHDLGPLGAAVNRSALERQLRILKEMGCDAIRTSHNMPSPEQVELCDELGMMMMAESFDEWARPKCKNGYNRFYEDWVEKDVVNLVRHYRNHPSIIMWSAGNEVPDQHSAAGVERGRNLQNLFHKEDPTRPVTMGMDQVARTLQNGFASYWDVPGLNYRLPLYGQAFLTLPQGILLGSETASTVSSRGVYKFPVKEYKNKSYSDGQCSSYDLEACSWSNIPDDDWVWQDDYPWVIGEFVWTGFDYLGEPTPYDGYWPSRSSYFGICDLAGLPKDRYYLYRSRWNTQSPTLHVLPHWNWQGREGDTIPVFVYTNYPSAELFINGKSQGIRYKCQEKSFLDEKGRLQNASSRLERYRLMWMNTRYEPGTLKVIAYDAQGNPVAETVKQTAGEPHHIELEVFDQDLSADEENIAFVTVKVVDAQGRLCPAADNTLRFQVRGNGCFRAACNGDPTSLELFHQPQMKAFNGQLVVLVQSNGKAGNIRLNVESEGLKPAKTILSVQERARSVK